MSLAAVTGHPRTEPETLPLSLFDVLHNSLVLANTVPHLPVSSLLHLAAADRAFRALVFHTPGVFRHLDLSRVKTAQFDIAAIWRHAQLDENLTEDEFYSGPLRGVFAALDRRHILRHVQTLVLDGLSVTSELCHEIINDAAFSVRILSLRDVKNLNQGKLRGALRYACRKTRPPGSPRLQALYVFGSRDAPPPPQPMRLLGAGHGQQHHCASSVGAGWNHKSKAALTTSLRRQGDAWWSRKGRVVSCPESAEWASCMVACEGIVAFDAVVCHGPRHRNSPAASKASSRADAGPAVAVFAVAGCEGCGTAPEGLVHRSNAPASLPLLAPPPILSSSVSAATTPHYPFQPFVARCADCLRERYCAACHKWWCEACYQLPGQGPQTNVVVVDDDEDGFLSAPGSPDAFSTTTKIKGHISKSCWECGNNCDSCIDETQRVCRKCCGGYCIIHNEGSSASHCDWCVSRGRGLGRL